MGAVQRIEIRPQAGPQERFLSTSSDIAIYGGTAGCGKTRGLLMEAMRHVDNPLYGGVIFRREAKQITNQGGLWHASIALYHRIATPFMSPRHGFRFPSGAMVSFDHLNQELDVLGHQGAEIPFIGWDELTHFTRYQFFYMLSRNRSTSGVEPYMRATTNPDSDSWVAEFIAWWIDQDSGYAIPERSGVLRYMLRIGDDILWGNSREELVEEYPHQVEDPLRDIMTVTFIPGTIYDNPALLEKDPRYLARLKAMPTVERERLLGDRKLGGNWKIRPSAGLYFKRQDATLLETRPEDVHHWVRSWDLAATPPSEANPDPDYTAGPLIGRRQNGRIVVADCVRVQRGAEDVRSLVYRTAQHDTAGTTIRLQQDPGQAGKDQIGSYITMLSGYPVFARRMTGDKVVRASPLAAQWQAGNVDVVRGPWNEAFFLELEGFPEAKHDDQVDAAAEGFAALPLSGSSPDYTKGGLHRVDRDRAAA